MKLIQSRIRVIVLTTLFCTMQLSGISQNSEKIPWFTKLVYGGNIGMQIGSETRLSFSPEVGYMFTDKLTAGVGISYEYYSSKLFDYKTSLYGGKLFGRYLVLKNVFAQAEYEALSLETEFFDVQNFHAGTDRFLVNSIFIGGGYRMPIRLRLRPHRNSVHGERTTRSTWRPTGKISGACTPCGFCPTLKT